MLTAALAAIGVYGLLAWVVNEQRRELAIRLALGATPTRLAQRVTAHGLALAAAGVTFGIVAVQGLRTGLDAVLFQIPTWDPVAIGTAGVVVLAAALAASVAPAWRAARVQPGEGLKEF